MYFFLTVLLFFVQWQNGHSFQGSSSNKSINHRIVGGQAAYPSQFPFMAAISVQTSSSQFFCAGSLISIQWILTAGHCVAGAILFTIQLGSTSLTAEDPNRLTLATSNYVVHPDYDTSTLVHDIGLIRFRLPISLTDYIRVTDYFPTSEIVSYQSVVTVGWGQLGDYNASLSDEMQWVLLTTLTNSECQLTYGTQITDTMVCVSGNYQEGPCIGDSGAPLLQIMTDNRVTHLGISSFVSGNGCENLEPAGYTRTYSYVDWIRSVTGIAT